jgi:hypothetical protein
MMKVDLKQLKKLSDLRKLESVPPSVLGEEAEDPMVTAIVQVSVPDYVPPEIRVRARIDPVLFTAVFPRRALDGLESDPKVRSVSLSRPQKLID